MHNKIYVALRLIFCFVFGFSQIAEAMDPPPEINQCSFTSNDQEKMECLLKYMPADKIATFSPTENPELEIKKWHFVALKNEALRKKLGEVLKIHVDANFPTKAQKNGPSLGHISRLLGLVQLCLDEPEQQIWAHKLIDYKWPDFPKMNVKEFAESLTFWQVNNLRNFIDSFLLEDWVKSGQGPVTDYTVALDRLIRSLTALVLLNQDDSDLEKFIFKLVKKLEKMGNFYGAKLMSLALSQMSRAISPSNQEQYNALFVRYLKESKNYEDEKKKPRLPAIDKFLTGYNSSKAGGKSWAKELCQFSLGLNKALNYLEILKCNEGMVKIFTDLPCISDRAFNELIDLKKRPSWEGENEHYSLVEFAKWNASHISKYFEEKNLSKTDWQRLLMHDIHSAESILQLLAQVPDKGRMLAKLWNIDIKAAKELLGEDANTPTASDGSSGETKSPVPKECNSERKKQRGSSSKKGSGSISGRAALGNWIAKTPQTPPSAVPPVVSINSPDNAHDARPTEHRNSNGSPRATTDRKRVSHDPPSPEKTKNKSSDLLESSGDKPEESGKQSPRELHKRKLRASSKEPANSQVLNSPIPKADSGYRFVSSAPANTPVITKGALESYFGQWEDEDKEEKTTNQPTAVIEVAAVNAAVVETVAFKRPMNSIYRPCDEFPTYDDSTKDAAKQEQPTLPMKKHGNSSTTHNLTKDINDPELPMLRMRKKPNPSMSQQHDDFKDTNEQEPPLVRYKARTNRPTFQQIGDLATNHGSTKDTNEQQSLSQLKELPENPK